jgi:hypothetical protein
MDEMNFEKYSQKLRKEVNHSNISSGLYMGLRPQTIRNLYIPINVLKKVSLSFEVQMFIAIGIRIPMNMFGMFLKE